MDDTRRSTIPLKKTGYSVRSAKLIYQSGVGGMTDFLGQTLMTAAPELWANSVKRVYDQRLQKLLNVDYFGVMKGKDENNKITPISYVRFPEWYFCPHCRRLKPLGEWTKEYISKKPDERYYMAEPVCSKCHQTLIPSRIVSVCKHGHIDDFPWVAWVHERSNREICKHPSLELRSGNSSNEGIAGQVVVCSCGAKATLKGALDYNIFQKLDEETDERFNFKCTGRHPWKNTVEVCEEYPIPMQRGASSIYFPVIKTSLVIPPYSLELNRLVQECSLYNDYIVALNEKKDTFKNLGIDIPKEKMFEQFSLLVDKHSEIIANAIGKTVSEVKEVLLTSTNMDEEEKDDEISILQYKMEEYKALSGEVIVPRMDNGDFKREETDIAEYMKNVSSYPYVTCLKQVSLIHKIREIQALIGFTRVNPVDNESFKNKNEIVSIKNSNTNWYPAYEVRGEGIFIELDIDKINQWRTKYPELDDRATKLEKRYKESFFGEGSNKKITAKFLLLHTLSHLLIKELSFNCGYNIASLKERIYCSEIIDGKEMTGILIYTASGDSEGTLGGLVRQGRPDLFPSVFCKAIDSARYCSNDPVCSLSEGQGRDSLNLASCYSCSLIPETSCEEFNIFLDRTVVVGNYKRADIGFFDNKYEESISRTNSEKSSREVSFEISKATYMGENSYGDIFDSLYAETSLEQGKKDELVLNANKFEGFETPYSDCPFCFLDNGIKGKCDLYWQKAKVALFTSYYEDSLDDFSKTNIKCFCINDENFDYTLLLDALRES